jgi:hypothetical protein
MIFITSDNSCNRKYNSIWLEIPTKRMDYFVKAGLTQKNNWSGQPNNPIRLKFKT